RSYCQVAGVSVERLIPAGRLEEIENRVRQAGGEIVALLKTGSAFYSPASAAVQMTEAYLYDKKHILPCAAYLEGEYDINGVYFGGPVLIGGGGGLRVITIALSDKGKKEMGVSVSHVQELVAAMDKVLAQSA